MPFDTRPGSGSLLGATCPAPHREQDRIVMGHGSGGRLSAELLGELIVPILRNPQLERLEDQAILDSRARTRVAFTTDSFVVSPAFFPGGDIGELAVNGTVNDLAVGGAEPAALSLGLILEEGLAVEELRRVLQSIRTAADAAGVCIVTGDTKVVGHGQADKIFINTTGIGWVPEGLALGVDRIEPGDGVIVSGTIADHGMAIMACREGIALEGQLESDTAPLHELSASLLQACPGVKMMRDPTRGGVAATAVEIATRSRLGIELDERRLPIRSEVAGACELLGVDPLLVANEGKLVAVVAGAEIESAVQALRSHRLGRRATCIGRVVSDHRGEVVITSPIGGRRILDLPYSEPLPRIC